MFDRVTRIVLALSAAGAVLLQTYLGARTSAHLLQINLTLFTAALVAARVRPRIARWLVLVPAYVCPAVVLVTLGHFDDACWSAWTALLVGYVIGRAPAARWALPQRWQWPLGLWGLCVALSWPIIVWRELDFTLAQLDRYTTGVTYIGIAPAAEVLWIANVAATHLLGILLLDDFYRDDAGRARQTPFFVAPLLWSAALSSSVALYQMFGHITFLNETIFGYLLRASGAMVDANAFAVAAAMWIAGGLAVAASEVRTPVRIAAGAAALLCAIGVWGSGSQSALVIIVTIVAGGLYGLWRLPRAKRAARRVVGVAVLAAVLLATALVVVSRHSSSAVGPIARLQLRWGQLGGQHTTLANFLWVRDGYGTVAAALIRRFPLTGIGIGTFNTYALDEGELLGVHLISPDNAQNWMRHQIAEMGLLGCLGWIIWVVFYLPSLFRRPSDAVSPVSAYVLRGAIVGLGLASCVGMPTQNAAALITFWAFVRWHDGMVSSTAAAPARSASRLGWLTAVVLLTYVGLVWHLANHQLRLPARAAELGWPYDHGVYELEKPAQGPSYRWTQEHAVVTVVVPTSPGSAAADRYLPVTFWSHHPDLRDRPLHVRIRLRGEVTLETTLRDTAPVTRYLKLAPGERGVMIETWVDRTWQPATSGAGDDRTLGIAIAEGEPVCCPADRGAVIAG